MTQVLSRGAGSNPVGEGQPRNAFVGFDVALAGSCDDFGRQRWRGDVTVAVNLSPAQFRSPARVGAVASALAAAGLAPGRLELEITEGLLLQESQANIDTLNALYEDVKPGDRYALTYLPRLGTELALNGRRLGVVGGADFAAAVSKVIVLEHPAADAVRSIRQSAKSAVPAL